MDQRGRRETYQGFGDTLARAFELALTPAIFAGGGYLLDRWLGTAPVLAFVFFLVCAAGMFVRMYYGYAATMDAHAARLPRGEREP